MSKLDLQQYAHTPGPWMIFPDGSIGSAAVRTEEHTVITPGTVKGYTIGTAMKNAHLIAAAPELLEACKEVLRLLPSYTQHMPDIEAKLTAAIAKAEARHV